MILDPNCTISVNGGTEIPINLNKVKEARETLKKAMGDKSDDRQAEAFSPEETGQTVAAGQLRAFIERIERLEEDKQAIADDIKEVYAEAKGNGYDVKVLRKVVALRKRDLDERKEEEAVMDLYLQCVGESA